MSAPAAATTKSALPAEAEDVPDATGTAASGRTGTSVRASSRAYNWSAGLVQTRVRASVADAELRFQN
eukprot:s1073_g6.t1